MIVQEMFMYFVLSKVIFHGGKNIEYIQYLITLMNCCHYYCAINILSQRI